MPLAILAEARSDTDALAEMIRNAVPQGLSFAIKHKPYGGCGHLRRKGMRDVKLFVKQGVKVIIVCHAADRSMAQTIHDKVMSGVVKPSGYKDICCIVIPVVELEAWLIADEVAVNKAIPSVKFPSQNHPEMITDPKKWLLEHSRNSGGKPIYVPTLHNRLVAKHLDRTKVSKKCPSFAKFLSHIPRITELLNLKS
jgi:hypothetical protein